MSEGECVKVVVRCRPANSREKELKSAKIVRIDRRALAISLIKGGALAQRQHALMSLSRAKQWAVGGSHDEGAAPGGRAVGSLSGPLSAGPGDIGPSATVCPRSMLTHVRAAAVAATATATRRATRRLCPVFAAEEPKTFTFDNVYDDDSVQKDVYDETAFPLVKSVMEGYNGTIFGQTMARDEEERRPVGRSAIG